MAKTQTLKAETRQRTGSGVLKQMRREGYIPSVVYGGKSENANIKVNTKTLTDMLAASASANIIVDLEIDGAGKQSAFIQDTQKDPLTGQLLHADFLAVSDDTIINANLPVILHGEPVGVKAGGILEQMIHSLEITCSPKDLPETLDANVENIEVGQSLSVGDLELPEGVSAILSDDVLVAIVNESRATKSGGAEDEGNDAAEGEEASPEAEAE
ncbi:MAG: 50S ribosomal protein L25 [Akkermansiaceae bacterium]